MPTLAALDPSTVPEWFGSAYPEVFRERVRARRKRPLGNALGLTHYGVNLVTLPPGTWSALRHWHTKQDEFVFVVEGELVLVTDAGEQRLRTGMVAGFPAGNADGHHLVNRSAAPAIYLEVGDRVPGDEVHYPDADLFVDANLTMRHKSGEPY